MNKLINYCMTSGAVFALTALPALAQSPWLLNGRRPPRGRSELVRSVPEIDASAGLLAIAAVMVIMAFLWERNRRAV